MTRTKALRIIDGVGGYVAVTRPDLYYTVRILESEPLPDKCPGCVGLESVAHGHITFALQFALSSPYMAPWTIYHEFGHIIDLYRRWVRLGRNPCLFRQWWRGVTRRGRNSGLEHRADNYALELKPQT